MSDSPVEAGSSASGLDGWVVINLDTLQLVRANEQGLNAFDLDTQDLPAPLSNLLSETDYALAVQRVLPQLRQSNVWHGRLRLGGRNPTGVARQIVVTPHVSLDPGAVPLHATLFFTSEHLAAAALTVPDPLTGLRTRSALFDQLERALRRSRRTDEMVATLFIDLDGLKKTNDRYGHEVGDTTLIETAQRLSTCLGDNDMAIRFGGDEFVVLCESVLDHNDVAALASRILKSLQGVGSHGGQSISASIGIALTRGGKIEGLELIRRADSAMYRAKARGGSQVAVFDAKMQTKQRSDQALRASLLQAISNNGFGIAAQPIFELATGRITAVELFIRLHDQATHLSSAADLFRLAHEHGEAIDAAVLGRAIALTRTWQGALGTAAPRVHINVSAQSLVTAHFVRRVGAALRRDHIRTGAIAFEVDGQDLSPSSKRELATIDGLIELGVPVVIDGYGGDAQTLVDIDRWRPAMVKIAGDAVTAGVLTGLVRAVSALQVQTCVKRLATNEQVQAAVSIGAYAGQGNALTPVRQISRVNKQLHDPPRIGF